MEQLALSSKLIQLVMMWHELQFESCSVLTLHPPRLVAVMSPEASVCE